MLPQIKIDALLSRHAALEAELSSQLATETFIKLSRELSELSPVVEKIKAYLAVVREIADLDAMIGDQSMDSEMRDIAQSEKPALVEQRTVIEQEIRLALLPKDAMDDRNVILEIRAQGAGGQHVNKTESAIRITHLPSGIIVFVQEDRSQHKNKAKALKMLRAKLYDAQRSKLDAERAADRKGQVGTGDRSERIRTYNYPQGRVSDHRINLTLHKLPQIMEGGALGDVITALITEHQASLLLAEEGRQ